jgi:hypothetical protein
MGDSIRAFWHEKGPISIERDEEFRFQGTKLALAVILGKKRI